MDGEILGVGDGTTTLALAVKLQSCDGDGVIVGVIDGVGLRVGVGVGVGVGVEVMDGV